MEPVLYPVYRARFNFAAAGSGDAVTIFGHATKIIRVHHLFISKPSVQVAVTVEKRTADETGGTGVALAAVPLDPKSPATAVAVVKKWTAVPTAGTSLGVIYGDTIPAGDRVDVLFGRGGGDYPTLRAVTDGLAVTVDGAVTLEGFVEWSELNT